MPLIDLQTDLKNLGYGSDKPHVTKDINNPPNYNSISNQVTARVDDVTRITKMFASSNGIKFVANEALLGSGDIGKRIKNARAGGKTLAGALLQEAGSTLVQSGKTVASLIAQTAVAGTGNHIIRGFKPANTYLGNSENQSDVNQLIGGILPSALGDLDPQLSASALAIEGSTILQDNRGEGYSAAVQSNLAGRESIDAPKEINKYSGGDGKVDSSLSSVNSILKDQAVEVDPTTGYTGEAGTVSTGVSKVNTNLEAPLEINSQEGYTGQSGRVNTGLSNVETKLSAPKEIAATKAPSGSALTYQSQVVTGIPKSGYAIPQVLRDQEITITDTQTKDKDGNPITVRTVDSIPYTPSRLGSYIDANPFDGSDTLLPDNAQKAIGTIDEDDSVLVKNYYIGDDQYKDYAAVSRTDGKASRQTTLIDFRTVRRAGLNVGTAKYNGVWDEDHENGYHTKTKNTWKQEDTLERKFGIGSPGLIRASYDINYDASKDTQQPLRQDKINLLDVGESPTDFTDMIPFKIVSVIPNGKTIQATPLYFRAFLDKLDDNFNGSWSSFKYIGRADTLYAYDGFDRKLTFGFKVAAMTKEELMPIYNKLNHLASMTAPTYEDGRFMRGTYARVTIGDYVSELPGIFNSISFGWDINTPWEIDTEKEGLLRVPHMLTVSVDMSVIHDFSPITLPKESNSKYLGYNTTPANV